jgi:antitoxin ParD1/3/4
MPTMVPSKFQEFIDREVASGKFRSPDDVVSAAMRLFEERERKLDAIRDELMIGIEQLDRGEGIPIDEAFAQVLGEDLEGRS